MFITTTYVFYTIIKKTISCTERKCYSPSIEQKHVEGFKECECSFEILDTVFSSIGIFLYIFTAITYIFIYIDVDNDSWNEIISILVFIIFVIELPYIISNLIVSNTSIVYNSLWFYLCACVMFIIICVMIYNINCAKCYSKCCIEKTHTVVTNNIHPVSESQARPLPSSEVQPLVSESKISKNIITAVEV
jgi:hypothetical protein